MIIGGSLESDGALAGGFLDAGQILLEHWKAHRPDDGLGVPILYNLRHGIELALKSGIREAAVRLRADGASDPDVQSDAVDVRLARTHAIGALVTELTTYLGRLRLGPGQDLPEDTVEVLQSLHLLDEKGQAFRYSTVKTGSGKNAMLVPTRPDQQHFDLPAVAEALYDAGTLVLYGVDGVLDTYAQYQQEMEQLNGSEI